MHRPDIRRSGALIKLACLALVAGGALTALSAARLPYEAAQGQRVLERAYAETLATGTPARPFARSDIAVAGRLVYPRLGQSLVLVDTDSEAALDAGPALIPGSASIGRPGTSVISAHNDTHFAFLRRARVGDRIEAAGPDGQMHAYRVTAIAVIDKDDFTVPMGIGDNRIALYTCYPFTGLRAGDRRFVVHAQRDE